MAKEIQLEPVSPGEMLLEEFLKPMELSQYRLAKEIGVAQRRDRDRQARDHRRH